jgi:hypothetical protein
MKEGLRKYIEELIFNDIGSNIEKHKLKMKTAKIKYDEKNKLADIRHQKRLDRINKKVLKLPSY